MKNHLGCLLLLLVSFSFSTFGQGTKNRLDSIELRIAKNNDEMMYDVSLDELNHFLKDETTTSYERYYAWILKSFTHKRLFDYPEALRCLDSASVAGILSSKKLETVANIKAEKAYIYFDTKNYGKSVLLMQELQATNYKYISESNRPVIIMQLGYIKFLNGDYSAAEKQYNTAIALLQKIAERNLPMVYGKKVQLYGMMQLPAKRDQAFALGMKYAEKYNILKYKMYLYESLHEQFIDNKNYKEAYFADQKLDSLTALYNADENRSKLKVTEQKDIIVEKESSLVQQSQMLWLLAAFAICLILIISLTYYLLVSKKKSHLLLEGEYKRIFDELYLLTQSNSVAGNSFTDLSQYNLSERQLAVIMLLKEGKSNKQMAESLFISEHTVKYHLKSIYDILNIENRNEFYRLIK